MATPAGQDLTIYWKGTQVTGTSGNVTRVLKRLPRFSPFVLKPDKPMYIGPMDLLAEQGDPGTEAMKVTLSMTHKIAGVASALAAERELMDEMRAWQLLMAPLTSGTLRIDRSTAAAAAVSTEVLYARCVSLPRYDVDVVAGDGMVEATRAFLETETEFYCPLPYFYNRTASTDEVTAAAPANADSWNNPGPIPCGVRIEVKAGGITNAPTEITITNSTNGYSFVWSKGVAFVAGDYIDWFYTDPREMALTAGTTITGATGDDYMELAAGNNSITALRSGGTGTATLTVSWKPRYLSL